MKINILLENGRSGFQIEGVNKQHLEAYIPTLETKTSKDSICIMHACMKAMQYTRKNLQRCKYILFQLPKMPSAKSKEWSIMDSFNNDLAAKIGCKIEYKRV